MITNSLRTDEHLIKLNFNRLLYFYTSKGLLELAFELLYMYPTDSPTFQNAGLSFECITKVRLK